MIDEVLAWMNDGRNPKFLASLPHFIFCPLEEHQGFWTKFGKPSRRIPAWVLLLALRPVRGGHWDVVESPVTLPLATVYHLTSAGVVVGHLIHAPRGSVRVDDNHVAVLRAGLTEQDNFTGVQPVLDTGNMLAFASGEEALLFTVKQARYVTLR